MPFVSKSQRRFLYSQYPDIAKEFAAATPKGAKLPEHVHPMETTLADKMAQQPFSRNERVIPKKEKMHPAVAQARSVFEKLHGHKFAKNAGRGAGRKK